MPVARIAPLTGLRIFAASLVVLHHFGNPPLHASISAVPILGDLLINVQLLGFVGVDLFFVLSGFILTHVYLDEANCLRVTWRDFWGARIARIYPLYLLAAIIALPPLLWSPPVHQAIPVTLPSTVLMLQPWIPFSATAWNPPGWSLGVEALFYALFPVLAPYVASRSSQRPLAWIGGLWLAGLAAPLWYAIADPDRLHASWVYSGTYLWREIVKYDPLLHLSAFLIGVVTARLFLKRAAAPSRRNYDRTLIVVLCIGTIMALGTNVPYMFAFDGGLSLIFALLIYEIASADNAMTRMLGSPFLVLLGEASYGVYLLHYPMWQWAARLLPHYFPIPGGYTTSCGVFGLYVVVLILVSVGVHLTVERPLRRRLRRILCTPPLIALSPVEVSRVA